MDDKVKSLLAVAFLGVGMAMAALTIAFVVLQLTSTAVIMLAVGLFALAIAGFITFDIYKKKK